MNTGTSFSERLLAGMRRGAVVGGGLGAFAGIVVQAIFIARRGWIPDAATTTALAALGTIIFAIGFAGFGIMIGGALGTVGGAILGRGD